MELLIIPLVLAIGAYYLNRSERKVEREIATDRQQEAALQAYLDRMTDLLLEKDLRKAVHPETLLEAEWRNSKFPELQSIAKTLTFTVLRSLDKRRKGQVIQFLYEADLIGRANKVVDLRSASLDGADLHRADLQGADLSYADLRYANLSDAILLGAELREANLAGANMFHTTLRGADLQSANLTGVDLRNSNMMHTFFNDADLSNANMAGAWNTDSQEIEESKPKSLKGAIMPDGSKHD
jgi:uncharacterized protein YjbI with pentapeptide repeats